MTWLIKRSQGEGWDLFRELWDLHRGMNRAFSGVGGGLAPHDGGALVEGSWTAPLDVYETKDRWVVKAELPGLDEKAVEVTLDGDLLTIRGEKKAEHEERDKNYFRMERAYGSFQRTVTLPGDIDREKIDASFKKGVLTITLPKTAQVQRASRNIAVKAE